MKKLFAPYEIAIQLKEKGFDEPCIAEYVNGFLMNHMQFTVEEEDRDSDWSTYTNSHTNWTRTKDRVVCSAPLYQQVVEWLREKHNKVIEVSLYYKDSKDSWTYEIMEYGIHKTYSTINKHKTHKTYNQALNEAINEALKLI